MYGWALGSGGLPEEGVIWVLNCLTGNTTLGEDGLEESDGTLE